VIPPRYAYSWRERAGLAILAADEGERRELLDVCEALARNPSRRGAEHVIDETGRTNEVAYTARFRVTYWADHAAKEVRIMDVRRF
jgi:hypothetical protein